MGILDKLFSGKPTRDEFAEIVLCDLEKKGVTGGKYDREGFSIRFSNSSTVIFLDNTYAHYCKSNKQQRAEAVAHLAGGFAAKPSIPEEYPTVRPKLMPIVRDACYSSLATLHLRSRGFADIKPTVTRPLADGLMTMLAYDTEHSIMQVNEERLAKWGVSVEDVYAAAIENLRDKTDPRLLVETEPGVYRSRWGDSYDSARILLTDLIYRLSLSGDPVAFIPNRDQLWVTGTENAHALQSFITAAEDAHFSAHPLSARLYLLADGKWQPYLPSVPILRRLCVNLLHRRSAVDYEQQKKALEAINAKAKTDIFVASYMVFKRKDDSVFSQAVWAKGVDTLLPETDFIALGIDPNAKNFLRVPWEPAFPLLHDLMAREEGLAPVRYRVRAFPGTERIEKLRAFATAPEQA